METIKSSFTVAVVLFVVTGAVFIVAFIVLSSYDSLEAGKSITLQSLVNDFFTNMPWMAALGLSAMGFVLGGTMKLISMLFLSK